jgi:cytochrome P450
MMARGTKFIYKVINSYNDELEPSNKSQLGFHPCIGLIRPILTSPIMAWVPDKDAKDNAAYVKYASSQMEDRILAEKSSPATRKDFMHYLLNAKDPESGRALTRNELDADASLLISAGSDTMSITLSSTLFYLLHNPKTLAKATTEVRKQFSTADDIIGGDKLQGLVYLRACVDEALRLAPPVPSHLPREVLPGGITIDGRFFPTGTVVGVSPFAIHHNPEYYPEPFAFSPERWLLDEDAGVASDRIALAKAAFCPFSLGPRGCVGKQVAYLEVMIAMARLLFVYNIRLPHIAGRQPGEGDPNSPHWGRQRIGEYQISDIFISDREGPLVEFRAR